MSRLLNHSAGETASAESGGREYIRDLDLDKPLEDSWSRADVSIWILGEGIVFLDCLSPPTIISQRLDTPPELSRSLLAESSRPLNGLTPQSENLISWLTGSIADTGVEPCPKLEG